jgi:hydroxymethylglutaryl-CoA reductase
LCFDGKLLLVGDALAQFRPHVGSSTNQAALDALLLEKVLKGEMGLKPVGRASDGIRGSDETEEHRFGKLLYEW